VDDWISRRVARKAEWPARRCQVRVHEEKLVTGIPEVFLDTTSNT